MVSAQEREKLSTLLHSLETEDRKWLQQKLMRQDTASLLRDEKGLSDQELLAAQIRLNERETENAPSSVLRLWRSFLGWVLALLFCWEVPVRLLLLPLLAPDLLDDLPPPALDQILGLLAGMLGLPF